MRLWDAYISLIDRRIVARDAVWLLAILPLKILIIAMIVLHYAGLPQSVFDAAAWPLIVVIGAHLLTFVIRRAVFIPEDHPAFQASEPRLTLTLAERMRSAWSALDRS